MLRSCAPKTSSARRRPASIRPPAISTSTRRGRSPRALITHGHSDHARAGHGAVLATRGDAPHHGGALRRRFRRRRRRPRRSARRCGSATPRVTFQPAGHVLGSAQIAVEADGLRIVASGDYKRRADPTCLPFVPVPCDIFITEATFAPAGLPPSRRPEAEIGKLLASLAQFPERAHLVGAYSLGKAQRVIRMLRDAGYDRPIYLHGSMERLCRLYEEEGVALGAARAGDGRRRAARAISPARSSSARRRRSPSAGRAASPIRCLPSPRAGCASASAPKQAGVELPLILSDHADWDELTATIAEIAPRRGLGHPRPRGGAGPLVRARTASRRSRCTWSATRTRRSSSFADVMSLRTKRESCCWPYHRASTDSSHVRRRLSRQAQPRPAPGRRARHGGGEPPGPLLVIAGAGSGKTNTLAHRVAHLIVNGADPHRILLMTFSRRAAAEMAPAGRADRRQRARPERRGAAAALAWSGTFHAIGARLLREYAGDDRPRSRPSPSTTARIRPT